nr:reverse transcriptase domain-containing protein [Tanacetum cinerariifolium]
MSTRSFARNLFPPLDNLDLTIRRRSRVDPTLLNDFEMATDGNGDPPVLDLRTMEELCQPTLNGRGRPISPIAIQATNFGLKNDMIQKVQNSFQFNGLSGDDANKHLDKFLHVTQSIKVNGVTDDALRMYIFPYSLTHHATASFDCLPRNSINTFEQMAKMFLGKYFLPSMVTKLRNKITNFCQCPDDGTFMKRRPEECYDLIKNMTAHHNDWDTFVQRSESSSSITSSSDPETVALKAKMTKINKNLIKVLQINQQVKAVTPNCETCSNPHSYNDCPAIVGQTQNVYAIGAYNQGGASHGQNPPPAYQAPGYQAPVHQASIPQPQVLTTTEFTNYMKANDAILKNMQTNMTSLTNFNLELKNMFGQFMKMNTASSSGSRTLPSNIITNSKEDLKGITTPSGNEYKGPTIPTTSSPPKVVERETEVTKNKVPPTNNESTKDVQPSVVQIKTPMPNSEPVVAPVVEPVVAPVSAPKPNPKPSIPYPYRLHDQKLHDKANDQKEKFFQIFKDLDFNISFADALILMPKFGLTIKSLLTNKEKLFELARTPLNKHCSTGDPSKFLIPCDFPRMDECLALADLGASINLMPLSMWNKLSLPELSPTCMTLELADRSISRPVRFAEDVFVKTGRALIDVYEGELTFHVGKEAVTFNLDQTLRYSVNYDVMSVNRNDLIDVACEEYSQEVLGFFVSGNPTPSTEPIVFNSSPTLTPFRDSDFLLKETDAFLAIDDEPVSSEIDDSYYDSKGEILLLKEFLNDDPSSPHLPLQELKVVEPTNEKSSIDEPPVVELKDLPPHLEYAFLEGDDKFPVIIAKDLKAEEKTALIKVLKSHKQALTWQLSDIKGIAPEFYTHKILMKDEFKPAVQHQRRVNPKIYEVIKKEVLKLLDAELIYLISGSPWVSPVDCVPKKGGFTVVKNEENELIPTRFGTLRALISDRGTHFCNDQFAKVMLKYGFTYRLSTAYHPQTSGQVEVSNRSLKRILERIVGENCASWSDKLDDTLWAFRTGFKTPIRCTPYKLVYEKTCHLPIELEHKAYWALKHCNYDLLTAGDHRKVQLNELNELRDQAYENSLIYKEKTKRIHDSKIKDRVFNVGDRVLLFNLRLKIFSGKLKTCWSGPFTITQVFPYRSVKLSQTDGPNFKVNGHRLKHYFRKDIPKMVVPDLQTFPKDQ